MHEDLPLRTTRMLGDFADDQVLPHRLGDLRATRFSLVELTRTVWFAADHAMEVTAVQIDDEETAAWAMETRSDDAGHTWTVVVLGAPAPPDARVTATGIGRLDQRTGRLLTNPADLMEYVLRLAGRSETFPQLRAEAAAEALELAGSLDEIKSVRLWLDEIAYSAGAVWTTSAARLYPVATVRGAVTDLDRLSATKLVVTSDIEDTTDVLRLSYNEDGSNSRALAYIELAARPPAYGGVTKEVTLPWVRTASNAEAVGRRMMHRMAGRTVAIAMSAKREDGIKVRPCDWVRLVDNPGWPFTGADPVLMALAVSVDPDAVLNECTLEHTIDSPAVVVTAHSVAVPVGLGAGVDIAIANGVATIGVTDEVGKPLLDAWVSLDNGVAKKTDSQGKVQFEVRPSTPPRKHQLAVEAPGMTPFLLDIFF
jgi:hypothetical protein